MTALYFSTSAIAGEESETHRRSQYGRTAPVLNALVKGLSLNVSDPLFDGMESGEALWQPLYPVQPEIQRAFEDFINLDFFWSNSIPPENREDRIGYTDDLAHQRGLQLQINAGRIQKGDLIFSDTGHDIPLAVQLFKNYHRFRSQAVFYYPEPLTRSSGNFERIMSQAQDWASDIGYYQELHAREGLPEVLFFGLEGHRKMRGDKGFIYKVPFHRLPDWETFRTWGFRRVVFMTERPVEAGANEVIEIMREDLMEYLETSPFPVIYMGVDCRRGNGC